jgi:hypothetical protein
MGAPRLTTAAAALGVIAAPPLIAVIGAAPASADPGACVRGPWGWPVHASMSRGWTTGLTSTSTVPVGTTATTTTISPRLRGA